MAKKTEKVTPLMQQYNAIKAKYPGTLLLFRVGDFYETFGEDAIKTAQILGIVLTRRGTGPNGALELAGFPHHSLENYLSKLVRAGQRVAICDQLEDPKSTKTIVKRGVTELVTPGVSYNDNIINQKRNNYLASIYFDKQHIGISFFDISTGEFLVAQGNLAYVDSLIQTYKPTEVLYQKSKRESVLANFGDRLYIYPIDDWAYSYDYAHETLCNHFEVNTLKGYGVDKLVYGIVAAGVILYYLGETEHKQLQHITQISRIEEESHMWLDRFTIRNLELVGSGNEGALTLYEVLDSTKSAMGARLLHKWILMPLVDIKSIQSRLDFVDFFKSHPEITNQCLLHISSIGDIERLISKVGLLKANPRELSQLYKGLQELSLLKALLLASNEPILYDFANQLNTCDVLQIKLGKELHLDPPVLVAKGGVIADGISDELDKLRKIAFGGKEFLLEIQKREILETGIPSLKIAFNNVFGYYLEVTHTHKDKVPESWIRKQTLVNAERYITPELKEYEDQILGAEEKIAQIESQLYFNLLNEAAKHIKEIQINAQLISKLDVLTCFAVIAEKNYYSKPQISKAKSLNILGGRHPVIEKKLPLHEEYITNDVYLDNDSQQIMIITGPNMAGKSALLRQTALIVLMAQIGCFVPAKKAEIGLIDKIFTRVGASDNLSSGESTFMVEMNETASILNNISDRSLILLDEIGRGTSTYDGISIAWAIAEYLHEHPTARPKTLFATHYHELNELESSLSRIKNFNVSIKEAGQKIIFLRKLVPGGSEHSFGIHVAKLAGMPSKLISRSQEILKRLEIDRTEGQSIKDSIKKVQSQAYQLQMFAVEDPTLIKIRDSLNNLDVNSLTPVEALIKLDEIQRLIKN